MGTLKLNKVRAQISDISSPIVGWRKNDISDAADIMKLMGSQYKDHFGDVNVSYLIERAYFSISQIDSSDRLVSHIALFDYPNIPAVPPWDWVNWATNLYGLERMTSGNSLFIHLIAWNRKYSLTFLKPLIEVVFLNCKYLENLLMVVPPGISFDEIFDEYFTTLLPKSIEYSPKIQTLNLCVREICFPKLNIRMAFEEDHDRLVSFTDKQNSKLKSVYGDYYMSEVIANTEDRKVLVAESNGILVGVMSISTAINVINLIRHFELTTFSGLHIPDSQDKWVSKTLKLVNSLQRINDIASNSSLVTIYEEDDSGEETPLFEELYEISHVKIDSSKPISLTRDGYTAQFCKSVNRELFDCISLELNDSNGKLNPHGSLFSVSQEELFGISDVIRLTKPKIILPTYWGKGNAFCIELLAVHEDCDESQVKDLLQEAFEISSGCDFCLISLPFYCTRFPLIENFVRCTPRYYQKFPQELFLIHRNFALSTITVRYSTCLDKNGYSLLKTIESHEGIDLDFLTTSRNEDKSSMSFIVESQGSVIGLVIICEGSNINYLQLHYKVEMFDAIQLTEPAEHGEILHMTLSPIFKHHSKFILGEVLRLSGMACLYYRLFPPWHQKRENQQNIMTAIGDMMPVRPRRNTPYCRNNMDGSKSENDTLKSQDPYALYMLNIKLINQLTIPVNTRIIVVGASTTALSFLENMMFRSACEFLTLYNITLVSSFGLPNGETNSEIANIFIMDGGFYSCDYLVKISLRAWVNTVYGVMSGIDRRKRTITVNYDSVLKYDYLVILTGEQFQDELVIVDHKLYQDSQRKCLYNRYSNSFCINSYADAVKLLDYLKKKFCKSSTKKIIVYGCSIEAYTAIAALRKSHYGGEYIILVENFSSETHTMSCFNNDEVYEGVMEAIKKEGIEILKGYQLESWAVKQIKNEVTKITFSKKNICKTFDCLVFINYGEKHVDHTTYLAISNSSLVFDGKLVIEPNFSTSDSNIFAAGPLTKYAGRLHAEGYEHRHYNSREVGKKMCEEIQLLWNPKYKKEMGNSNEKLFIYKKPLVTACKLPGGWNYFNVCKAGIQVPLNEAMSNPNYGKVLITGDCYSENNGYFRVHLNNQNLVETITFYTQKNIDVGSIIKLYGMHEKLFHNMTKHGMGWILDYHEFFHQSWASAIYDNTFSSYFTGLLNSFRKEYGTENILLTEIIKSTLETWQCNEKTEEKMKFLKKLFITSLPKRKIELKTLEYICKIRH